MAIAVLFQGCVGYDRALFSTKTNVGIDLDTQPPTAEVNVARKELVIAPTFDDGQTPPVLGSFRLNSGFWIFADVSTTFSGGDAAVTMAALYSDETMKYDGAAYQKARDTHFDSSITVAGSPDKIKKGRTSKGAKDKGVSLNAPNHVKPFYLATDTSLGVKATWNGMTAAIPDSFRIGFNRKEFALAPVFGSPRGFDLIVGRAGKKSDIPECGNAQVVLAQVAEDSRVHYRIRRENGEEKKGELADDGQADEEELKKMLEGHWSAPHLTCDQKSRILKLLAGITGESLDKGMRETDVRIPSFLATSGSTTRIGAPKDSSSGHIQYFATGKAANLLALRQPVRIAMAERLDPVSADVESAIARAVRKKLGSEKTDIEKLVDFADEDGDGKPDLAQLNKLVANTPLSGQGSVTGMAQESNAKFRSKLETDWRPFVDRMVKNMAANK